MLSVESVEKKQLGGREDLSGHSWRASRVCPAWETQECPALTGLTVHCKRQTLNNEYYGKLITISLHTTKRRRELCSGPKEERFELPGGRLVSYGQGDAFR